MITSQGLYDDHIQQSIPGISILILSCDAGGPLAAPRFWNEGWFVPRTSAPDLNFLRSRAWCFPSRSISSTALSQLRYPRRATCSILSLTFMVPRGSKPLAYPTCIPRATRRWPIKRRYPSLLNTHIKQAPQAASDATCDRLVLECTAPYTPYYHPSQISTLAA